jgi:hypothetical protein
VGLTYGQDGQEDEAESEPVGLEPSREMPRDENSRAALSESKMQYCDVEVQGFIAEECGEPASVKVEGRWRREYHADALERALARRSDPEWIARQVRNEEGGNHETNRT